MRIPTSVFVMSLVTAVPFGLAVRDTLHPHPKALAEMTDEEREAQFEADMQKQAETDRAAEQQRKQTVLGGLLGDKGKVGTYLDNLALGAPEDQAAAIRDRVQNGSDIIDFSYEVSQGKVSSIRISSTECDDLEKTIKRAWGEGNAWTDPSTHTRTKFDSEGCTLRIDRYVEIEQLIDKTLTASIPVAAIGKTLDQVPGLSDDDTLASPGLQSTDGEISVRFTTDDSGKIVGLSAAFGADADADVTLRARLDKLFGKGKQDRDTGEWDWKGKTPVHYANTDARIYLDIGAP